MPFGSRTLVELNDDLSLLRKIPGFPGYYINESGDVFSVRKLHQFIDEDGYRRVSTGRLRKAIHWLLARVFLPPPNPGQNEVRHLDGNPTNLALENLAWGTRKENAQDMAAHGTLKGESNPRAVLTEVQVTEIKECLRQKENRRELANRFLVSLGTIKAIAHGRNWRHVA